MLASDTIPHVHSSRVKLPDPSKATFPKRFEGEKRFSAVFIFNIRCTTFFVCGVAGGLSKKPSAKNIGMTLGKLTQPSHEKQPQSNTANFDHVFDNGMD